MKNTLISKDYLLNNLVILFGGRVAEELVLNHMTTGAGNDIEKATELARRMVCEWGMSEKLGPMTFGKKEEEIFLGRDFTQKVDYSESTAIEIDAEVRRIIQESYHKAKDLLKNNLGLLHKVAEIAAGEGSSGRLRDRRHREGVWRQRRSAACSVGRSGCRLGVFLAGAVGSRILHVPKLRALFCPKAAILSDRRRESSQTVGDSIRVAFSDFGNGMSMTSWTNRKCHGAINQLTAGLQRRCRSGARVLIDSPRPARFFAPHLGHGNINMTPDSFYDGGRRYDPEQGGRRWRGDGRERRGDSRHRRRVDASGGSVRYPKKKNWRGCCRWCAACAARSTCRFPSIRTNRRSRAPPWTRAPISSTMLARCASMRDGCR